MCNGLCVFRKNAHKEFEMLTEILAQKDVFQALCKKYFNDDLSMNMDEFPVKKWDRIVICASGSSKHTGEIARYVFEGLAKIPCSVEFASEFAHKDFLLKKGDLFIAISQSGNTADTFVALTKAKEAGAKTFAITNDITSKIHTNADFKVLADAGVEKSIAATKSFTAQLLILYTFAIALAEKVQDIDVSEFKKEFLAIADNYDVIYNQRKNIKKIAKKMRKAKSVAVLGRNINSALAQEGSLKIKETCYINANSIPAGEFMHGHFAFVDKKVPLLAIINKSDDDIENYDLITNNILDVKKKRSAKLILLKTVGDSDIDAKINPNYIVEIPKVNKLLTPFLNLVAIQILAYETAKHIHDNVDEPRDLIKCVANE